MCEKGKGYQYIAKVLSVYCESDDCDGVSNTTVLATFDIQIEAQNCSNDEFAKHFFNVFGQGQLNRNDTLSMLFARPDVKAGDVISISSADSFNAMLDREISFADAVLEQRCLRFLTQHHLLKPSREDGVDDRELYRYGVDL